VGEDVDDTIWMTVFASVDGAEPEAVAWLPKSADGWKSTINALPRYLPGCEPSEEWFRVVAHPPFVESGRLVYEREASV